MNKLIASTALGLMLVTGGATAASAQTATTTPTTTTTETKEDNSGKLGLLGLLGLAGLAGLARKKDDHRNDTRGATSVSGTNR